MIDFFIDAYKNATMTQIILEFLAFICGILSVWFAKKENILVYPTGLIATIITVYLLYLAGYVGDMLINAYFSVMSIYGWYKWSRKTQRKIIYQLQEPIKKKNNRNCIVYCNYFCRFWDLQNV
jgi:nicotinamide mononucleotide transporter